MLEEACTGADIDTSTPWKASVRRGMKINMSMLFFDSGDPVQTRCPRCQKSYVTQENASVQW